VTAWGQVCLLTLGVLAALGPRYGGELRIGALGAPPSTEARPAFGPTARLVLGMVHETLLRPGPDGPQPGLAESWTPNGDGKEWTLALHPRLQFHDGTDLTAADAARAVRRFLRGDSPAAAVLADGIDGGIAFRAGQSPDLPGVEAVDTREVRLRFRAPVAAWSLLPLASAAASVVSERGAACGPFVPTVSNGDEMLFVPFGAHVAGRPYLDRVAVRLVPETRRLTAERRLGRVDLAVGGGSGLVHAPGVLLLALDASRPPFDAKDLRAALSSAVDRESMAARMLPGAQPWHRLLPMADTPGQPGLTLAAHTRAPRPSSENVVLAVDRTLPPLASQRIVAHLADLGLTASVRAVEPGEVRRTAAEVRLLLFEPELAEPVLAVHEAASLFEPGAVPPAAFESDPGARHAMALELEERLRANGTLIPLARLSRSTEAAPHVRGARADAYTLRIEDAWTAVP
jgi:ABC-type transport system substrate-binding protein